MTERERLIDLLYNARHKYALLHYESNIIADWLLEHGVIVPPCKVGDSIYCIDQDADNNGEFYLGIFEGKIKTIALEDDGLWIYCSYNDGLNMWHKIEDDLNRIVFLNREEAEKVLRDDNNE